MEFDRKPLSRQRALGLLLTATGATLVAACSAPSAQPVSQSAPTAAAKPAATSGATAAAAPAGQPKSGGLLRSSQVGDPQSVDGHQFTPLTQDTMWLAYDRLLTYDDKLQPQPQLAESWEVSTDAKQIKQLAQGCAVPQWARGHQRRRQVQRAARAGSESSGYRRSTGWPERVVDDY